MIKGSAWHDVFYEPTKFENYPHLIKLLEAVRARPEFKGILANPKAFHKQIIKVIDSPMGVRTPLGLPV